MTMDFQFEGCDMRAERLVSHENVWQSAGPSVEVPRIRKCAVAARAKRQEKVSVMPATVAKAKHLRYAHSARQEKKGYDMTCHAPRDSTLL